MKITISVTRDDIDKGKPGQVCACPIWLALRRAFPAWPDPFTVGQEHITLPDDTQIPLPQAARDFITRFDYEHAVEPFAFELDVPDELAPAVSHG